MGTQDFSALGQAYEKDPEGFKRASEKIVEKAAEVAVAGAEYAVTRNPLTPWGVYNQIGDLQDTAEATTTRALKVYDLHRRGGHDEGPAVALTAVQVLADQTGGTAAFEAIAGLDTNRLLDTGDFNPTLSDLERGGKFLESGLRVFGTASGVSAGRQFLRSPATVAGRTNAELVEAVAQRAEAWGVREGLGTGPVPGTLKHGYADRLLTRYQRMYGDRGLSTEVRYLGGTPWRSGLPTKGSVILDVVEGPIGNPTHVWDYKFGSAKLTPARVAEVRREAGLGQLVPVDEVRP